MKQKALLGLLLGTVFWMGIGNISLAAEVPVDEAHFPDAAFRSYVSEKLDGNHDGQLSEEELASVTVISFEEGDAEGCESLEGIKYFRNLGTLRCENRKLKTLDLSGMSKFGALSCSNNQLTELNLEGTVNFVELYCSNNQLTSLEIESLEGMTFLYCGNNRLTNLKLQGDCWCLSCDHNELRSLDISGSVCYLNARFNYITEPSGNVVGGFGLEEMWSPRKSYTFVVNNSAQLLSKELFGDNLVMQGVLSPGNVFDNFEYTWFAPLKLKESEGIHYSEEDGGFYMDDFSGNSLHAAFTMENTRNGDIETIPVEIKRVPFADVNTGDWYAESAAFVNERGIMTGMNDTEFGPGVKLSRAQFATILYRMEGEPEVAYDPAAFPDVREGQFYTAPAMWAKSTGIISGYEDGRFGPADEITREQMAVMMYRYANMRGLDISSEGDMSGFPDAGQVSAFADKEVKWAVGAGLIKGDGGNVNPQGTAERAQCATIIMRFLESYGL